MDVIVRIIRSSDHPRQLETQTINTKTTMSKLETAMDTIIEVFQYYSSKEGDKFKLNRQELKNLLQGELGQYLQGSRDRAKVDEIMSDLDRNLDGTVSFEEFVSLVTQLTVHSCSFFQDYTPVVITCYQQAEVAICRR